MRRFDGGIAVIREMDGSWRESKGRPKQGSFLRTR